MWLKKQDFKRTLSLLPTGRIYRKAYEEGSNFNKLILWITRQFNRLTEDYNIFFKSLYICESDGLLEEWKREYRIPNDIFYEGKENRIDVFVIRYLMRGNKIWNFQAIANIYGLDVAIYRGDEYYNQNKFPLSFPIKFRYEENAKNILVISLLGNSDKDRFPLKFPISFRDNKTIQKIKKIYDIIKSANMELHYIEADKYTAIEKYSDKFPLKFPIKIGQKDKKVIKYREVKVNDEIKFCIGGKEK